MNIIIDKNGELLKSSHNNTVENIILTNFFQFLKDKVVSQLDIFILKYKLEERIVLGVLLIINPNDYI